MSLRIGTNNPSLVAQHHLSRTSRDLESGLAELSSGSKFSRNSKDPASHAISENLRAQVSGLKAAQQNADVAVSFVQTAEGSLNEQNNILVRMRELSVQAASDTFSDVERGFMNMEFDQLQKEFDRIALSTRFGATPLLAGASKNYEFQVGEKSGSADRISFENDADTRASSMDISGLSVSDKSDARDSLESIDEALTKIAGVRAKFGAAQSRLESATDFLGNQIVAVSDAKSRIGDADVAESVSKVRKAQILQQYQAAVLAQANQIPERALSLII